MNDNADCADTGEDEDDLLDDADDEDGVKVGDDDDCSDDGKACIENCWDVGNSDKTGDAVCEGIDGINVEFSGKAGQVEW